MRWVVTVFLVGLLVPAPALANAEADAAKARKLARKASGGITRARKVLQLSDRHKDSAAVVAAARRVYLKELETARKAIDALPAGEARAALQVRWTDCLLAAYFVHKWPVYAYTHRNIGFGLDEARRAKVVDAFVGVGNLHRYGTDSFAQEQAERGMGRLTKDTTLWPYFISLVDYHNAVLHPDRPITEPSPPKAPAPPERKKAEPVQQLPGATRLLPQ